ncbi:MAG: radical SAM protein [Candidatus Krumholzibacteriia bacterium]
MASEDLGRDPKGSCGDMSIEESENRYPRFSDRYVLHLTPSEGIVRSANWGKRFTGDTYTFGGELDFINNAAARLLSSSNGQTTLREVAQMVYPGSHDAKQKEIISTFFKDAIGKGHIELLGEKSASASIQKTGSFDYYVPIHISVELSSRCNLRCPYCYNEFSKNETELEASEVISLLDEWQTHGLLGAELTGGEPLLHKGFWDIFEFCTQNFRRTGLLTNGTLVDKATAKRIGKAKDAVLLSISMDGSCPEVHDKFRGAGSFEKSREAVRLLSSEGVLVRVGMSITPENIFDLENTVIMARDCGAKYFSFAPVLAFGRGKQVAWNWDGEKTQDVFKMEFDVIKKYEGFVTTVPKSSEEIFKKMGNCGMGYKNLVVSPSGKIKACLMLPEESYLGDIRKESLEEIFRKPILRQLREMRSPSDEDGELCHGCRYALYCKGCGLRPLNIFEKEGRICQWGERYRIQDWLPDYRKYPYDQSKPIFTWTK